MIRSSGRKHGRVRISPTAAARIVSLLQQLGGAGGMPPSHPTDEYRRKRGPEAIRCRIPNGKREMPMHFSVPEWRAMRVGYSCRYHMPNKGTKTGAGEDTVLRLSGCRKQLFCFWFLCLN